MQTKRWSFIETVVSTVIGWVITMATYVVVFPLMGIPVSLRQNLLLTVIFTVISVVRGFAVRRLFNQIQIKRNTHA